MINQILLLLIGCTNLVKSGNEYRLGKEFNEKLEAAFCNEKVVDSANKEVNTGKATLDAADPSLMKLSVPALTSGTYKAKYVGVGHDGHRRNGDYSFTVK